MKKTYLKSGFILSYIAIAVQSIISIVYTPVMLRLLGDSDYGLLQLATSTIASLGVLNFGFAGSYLRFYSSARASSDKNALAVLNGTYMSVFIGISILALIAGTFVTTAADKIFAATMSEWEIGRLMQLLGVMTLNLALSFPASVFDSYIVAHEKFAFQKLIVIITAFFNPMFTLPLLLVGRGSVAVAWSMVLITIIKLVVSWVYCVKKLNMQFIFKPNGKLLKSLCGFSFFIFLNIITDQINWNADKTILGIVRGSKDVAVYSLGAQFNTYFLTFSYALLSLFSPKAYRIARARHAGQMLDKYFARFGRIQLAVMGYIFLMLVAVGKPFIRIWSGWDTDIPYYTAVILIAPLLITSVQSIGVEIQRAKDMHHFRSILYFMIAFVNIAISIPLSMHYGALGAAAGTCVCLVIGNIIIMNFYYHKRVGLNMFYFWGQLAKLLPAFIAPVLCAVAVYIFCSGSLWRVAIGAVVLTLVYVPSVWFLGVRKDINLKSHS